MKLDDGLLREILEEHAKNPYNNQKLDSFSCEKEYQSANTGNTCKVQLKIENDCIAQISAEVNGSALAKACASIMCGELEGLATAEAQQWVVQIKQWAMGQLHDPIWDGDMQVYQSLVHYPERMDCATLCWRALGLVLAMPNQKESD